MTTLPPFRFQTLRQPPEEPTFDAAKFIVRSAKMARGLMLTEIEEREREADEAYIQRTRGARK
jgi:hypothetical protein